MKKLITIIIIPLLFLESLAFAQDPAQNIDITQMSQTELIQYQQGLKAAQKVSESSIPTAEKLEDYVNIGEKIGEAIAGIGKGVGEGGDAFLESTTGKIAIIAVIWKVMGSDFMTLVTKLTCWAVLISFSSASYFMWWREYQVFKDKQVVKSKEGPFWARTKTYETKEGLKWERYNSRTSWLICWFIITTSLLFIGGIITAVA